MGLLVRQSPSVDRPADEAPNTLRHNQTTGTLEVYDGANWEEYLAPSAATDSDVSAAVAVETAARIADVNAEESARAAALLALTWKAPVRVATTGNGTLATAFANGQVVDGVTIATGDRILIKDQSTGADRGIYTVNASGAPTRATDFDSTAEVFTGVACLVLQGNSNLNTIWFLSTTGTITVGTTALNFITSPPWGTNTVKGIVQLGDDGSNNTSNTAARANDARLRYLRAEVNYTTAASPAAYSRSTNVITFSSVGSQSVDGSATVLNDRVLLNHGAAGADNGIFRVSTKGTGGVAEVWTRASDMDESAEPVPGQEVAVYAGSLNAGTRWRLNLAPGTAVTLNTTALSWVRAEVIDAAPGVASLRTIGSTATSAMAGNTLGGTVPGAGGLALLDDASIDAVLATIHLSEVRVRRPVLSPGGTITVTSGTAYAAYLGQTREAAVWKHVEGQVNTAGSGAQTAEVGLFSSPLPPNKGGQTLTKLWADGTVDSLLAAGPIVVRNTSASATSVAAGVHLWAVIRCAMGGTQPTFVGVVTDMGQGSCLVAAACGVLTGLTTQAFSVPAVALGSVAPVLCAVRD